MFYRSSVLQNYQISKPGYLTSQVRPSESADIATYINLPMAVIDFHSWAWAWPYIFQKKLRLNNK